MGKWVSRVGSAGGGKTYKKARPSNYYALLVVIVVLGLASVLLARYDYQNPAAAASGTPPTIGTTWFSALNVEACGETLPTLSVNSSSVYGLTMTTNNVLQISPKSAADSGKNATLAEFGNEYPGLIMSNNELAIPSASGAANATTTYRNGELCPASSKYPKRAGQVIYAYWPNLSTTTPITTTNPATIKLVQYGRITMAFDPKGVIPKVPSQNSVNAMTIDVANAAGSTTTTTAPTTNTTAPTTTTTAKG